MPYPVTKQEVKDLFPKRLELKGFCPVSFAEGPPGFASIIPGDLDYTILYDDKLYSMANEKQRDIFKKSPWKYVDLVLPAKLPPPISPIAVSGLPMIGYLEQTVAKTLTEALTSVGKFKPKHPFKNLNSSACEFLGLYLKANNMKSKEWIRKSYQERLLVYKDNCELLRDLIQNEIPKTNYDSEKRIELNPKLQMFINLKIQK